MKNREMFHYHEDGTPMSLNDYHIIKAQEKSLEASQAQERQLKVMLKSINK